MRLSELKTGDFGVIVKILGHGAFRKRVMEMGFVRGRSIEALEAAPLKDPVKYAIMGYEVLLRRSEAHLIEVVKIIDDDSENLSDRTSDELKNISDKVNQGNGTSELSPDELNIEENTHNPSNVINVALIGNPNCGKTSLFNQLVGAREHVGNYSGVTVDAKAGRFRYGNYEVKIVDLPGTYSLAAYSPEELYVRRYLRNETPDVIVNVVDASNLERNLYLTTELIDMGRSMVIALNMYDELEEQGAKLDYTTLGAMIGVPIVPTISKNGKGKHQLIDNIIDVYEGRHESVRHVHVKLNPEIESAVTVLKDDIKAYRETGHHFSPRYMAIKLLEGDTETENIVKQTSNGEQIINHRNTLVKSIEHDMGEDINSLIAGDKYGFIAGALAETLDGPIKPTNNVTGTIDALVTNKLFGFPLFFGVMFFIFWLTFSLGQYPMDWIQNGIDSLSIFVHDNMASGPLKDMLADGVIGGVGGVIVFLPNIMILYFCISFMEDSGYMARAAFIMDKIMHKMGLHGKSFIPLIMGFGCNVPAITASRSIESKSSRLITIMINPFMSCSARLPIYVLLIGAFFPSNGAVVFMGLYLLGIVVAMLTARMLRRYIFHKDETPFVMELPPYRVPSLKTSLRHTWDKGVQYLKKMGGLILFASIVMWALNYFPIHDKDNNKPTVETSAIDPDNDSYLEMAGKAVNPVMKPLGFDWPATVAALAGVPAKEIVVSTLGVLYTDDEAVSDQRLGDRLKNVVKQDGQPAWPMASALSFMVFILLYCPCIATVVAISKETGSWKYGAFSVLYNTAVAWVVAFIVYRVALLF